MFKFFAILSLQALSIKSFFISNTPSSGTKLVLNHILNILSLLPNIETLKNNIFTSTQILNPSSPSSKSVKAEFSSKVSFLLNINILLFFPSSLFSITKVIFENAVW
jgi:hypothetical protein